MKLLSLGLAGLGAGCAGPVRGAPRASALLDDLEHRTFRWFWDVGNPANGLVPDRWPARTFCSIAAVGFALNAYAVGAERGWIARAQARDRTLATLRFFATAPQGDAPTGMSGHRGFFYHFVDMERGQRFETVELSSIDTALLLAGILFAGSYYRADHPDEAEIRHLAERINARTDWRWMLGNGPLISMGWTPEHGFLPSQWDRYNESTILHLLALGSPTFAVDADLWHRWTAKWDLSWGDHWGERHLAFPPLFGHQFSHLWTDFRGIRDPWLRAHDLDLFENSRRATRAQRNYAIANPGGWAAYGPDCWGLTACDGPGDFTATIAGRDRQFFGYAARGPGGRDDGTLAPTAMASSIAFEPALVLGGLAAMTRRFGADIYGRYGFLDAFNPTLAGTTKALHGRSAPAAGWLDTDYLGIDQGPIIGMIANYRDGLIWRTMRRSPPLVAGLKRAGFAGGWLDQAR
ncbi:MAG: glucoamylase family protein [Sphingomonas sp.]